MKSPYEMAIGLGVRFVRKDDSLLMRAIGAVLGQWFMDSFWTTIRFPFCAPTIYTPRTVDDPADRWHAGILSHELVHVTQWRPWWGPWFWTPVYLLFPLPFGFTGRWFFERPAFLVDIQARRHTPESAARQLAGKHYAWAWPEGMARRWFEEHSK